MVLLCYIVWYGIVLLYNGIDILPSTVCQLEHFLFIFLIFIDIAWEHLHCLVSGIENINDDNLVARLLLHCLHLT